MAALLNLTDASGGSDAYNMAKTAVITLVKSYANLLASHRIRVNAVAPTNCATPMVTENPALFAVIEGNAHLANAMQTALPDLPMTEPRDVSQTILYIISEMGRACNDSLLTPDAGMVIRRWPQARRAGLGTLGALVAVPT